MKQRRPEPAEPRAATVRGNEQERSGCYTPQPPSPSTTEPPFLALWRDPRRRGPIGQFFHRAVRERQAAAPAAVLSAVRDLALERLAESWLDDFQRQELRDLLQALVSDRGLALAYAAEVLTWNALSPQQRQARKAARGRQFQLARMEQDGPTDKQLDYLRLLGYEGTPATKAEASRLIDSMKGARGIGGQR